jgi:hypothetical protein
LALTSLTNGGRSVNIVRSRTQATDFVYLFLHMRSAVAKPNNPVCSQLASTLSLPVLVEMFQSCLELIYRVYAQEKESNWLAVRSRG